MDAIIVWRLDRWGRSVADLIGTIRELTDTSLRFISLNEAFDLITPAGKASVFLFESVCSLEILFFFREEREPTHVQGLVRQD